MPNMGRVISAHNKKVKEPQGELPPCLCTLYECPVEGTCEKKNIIYQCTVTENTSGKFKIMWDFLGTVLKTGLLSTERVLGTDLTTKIPSADTFGS